MIIQTYLLNKNPGPGIKAVRLSGLTYDIYLYDNRVIAVAGSIDEQAKSAVYNPGPGDHTKTAAHNAIMKETENTIRYHTKSMVSFVPQANDILSKTHTPFKVTATAHLVENEPKTTLGAGGLLFIPENNWNTALSKAITDAKITFDEERAGKLIKVMRDLVVQWNPALEPIDGNPTDMKFEAEIGIMEKVIEPKDTYTGYMIYDPKIEATESKFKAGDLVEIVGPPNANEVDSGNPGHCPESMKNFIGQKLKIIGCWLWRGDWLKPVVKEFRVGDKVKIISHKATNEILPSHKCGSNQNYAIGTIHTIVSLIPWNKEAVILELYWMAKDDLELVE